MKIAEEEEFREFMQSRWPGLVRLGYGLTGDRGLAEDLAQTALAKTYASWSRVRKVDDPDAYVRRILINANNGRFRKRRVIEHSGELPPETGVADLTGTVEQRSVLAAVAVSVPLLVPKATPQPPAAPVHHKVTVDQLGPTARDGVIGSGTVDGTKWTMVMTPNGSGSGAPCFEPSGGAASNFSSCGELTPSPGMPVTIDGLSGGEYGLSGDGELGFETGVLRSDVAKVIVNLADGEVLSPAPVTDQGQRYVVFAVPPGLGVLQVTALSASGAEVGYSPPFNAPNGFPMFTTWYQAGQEPGQAAAGQIASGQIGGVHWSIDVTAGPFGECFSSSGLPQNLGPERDPAGTPPISQVLSTWSGSYPLAAAGFLNPAVDYLIEDLSNGQTVRLEPVVIGGGRYVALVVPFAVQVVSVTSYDSAGHQLGRQTDVGPQLDPSPSATP